MGFLRWDLDDKPVEPLKLPATVALLLVLLLFELADLFLGGIPLLYGEHVRARKRSNFKSCRDVLG